MVQFEVDDDSTWRDNINHCVASIVDRRLCYMCYVNLKSSQ